MRPPSPAVPGAVSVLQPFVDAGIFDATEVHLAATVARLQPELADEVVIAVALAARGPRLGHVCVELAEVPRLVVDTDDEAVAGLPWPDLDLWVAALETSPAVASPADDQVEPLRPLVWDGARTYLHRYWRHETATAEQLRRRSKPDTGTVAPALHEALDALFGAADPTETDLQRQAALVALTGRLAVIAGGPGTGKTRTVARLLATARRAADDAGRSLEVALAAPTGKAAARMTEAVRAEVADALTEGALSPEQAADLQRTEATTLHRLLGWLPGSTTRFRHDRTQPLPHDLVIVDETSMVSLPLMSRLLDAVRPDARLVLVGDPFQLASVEAGTVMGDVVGPAIEDGRDAGRAAGATQQGAPLAERVTVLRRVRRFTADSAIAALADAVRIGDADRALALLRADDDEITWVLDDDEPGRERILHQAVEAGAEVLRSALAGEAEEALTASQRLKVLAATRHGDLGVYDWSDRIEASATAAVPELRRTSRWYPGRPVIITANDDLARVANGDVGVLVHQGDGDLVALPTGDGVRFVPPSRLDAVDTWWAMTIHKSQGSEFPHAVVSLPTADSPILTRELLYTAVTRAREQVTVVASEAAVIAAIARPVARASGLRDRLWPA